MTRRVVVYQQPAGARGECPREQGERSALGDRVSREREGEGERRTRARERERCS